MAAVNATVLQDEDGRRVLLAHMQLRDITLKPMIDYLSKGLLPVNDRDAHQIVMTQPQYSVIGGVLYRMAAHSSLRVILPFNNRRNSLKKHIVESLVDTLEMLRYMED